jgi:hypothetical protein
MQRRVLGACSRNKYPQSNGFTAYAMLQTCLCFFTYRQRRKAERGVETGWIPAFDPREKTLMRPHCAK